MTDEALPHMVPQLVVRFLCALDAQKAASRAHRA
jgi:hypothetical protein